MTPQMRCAHVVLSTRLYCCKKWFPAESNDGSATSHRAIFLVHDSRALVIHTIFRHLQGHSSHSGYSCFGCCTYFDQLWANAWKAAACAKICVTCDLCSNCQNPVCQQLQKIWLASKTSSEHVIWKIFSARGRWGEGSMSSDPPTCCMLMHVTLAPPFLNCLLWPCFIIVWSFIYLSVLNMWALPRVESECSKIEFIKYYMNITKVPLLLWHKPVTCFSTAAPRSYSKNFTLVTDQTISLKISFISLQIFKGLASLTFETCVSMSGLKCQASGSNLGDL